MQDEDWDDVRFALALHRGGAYAEAARRLGVSETTVARRVAALEQRLGAHLLRRNPRGRLEPTEIGREAMRLAEQMESAQREIRRLAGQAAATASGVVRLSAVPILINRILVPEARQLEARHPGLTLELAPEPRNLDLTKREADLALRLARPRAGGAKTLATRIGQLAFGSYAAAADADAERWILYEPEHAALPQARRLAQAAARPGADAAPVRVADLETALEAVAAGLGKTLLPRRVADADPRLRRLPDDTAPPLRRAVWMLSHADDAARPPVSAVKEWLRGLSWD